MIPVIEYLKMQLTWLNKVLLQIPSLCCTLWSVFPKTNSTPTTFYASVKLFTFILQIHTEINLQRIKCISELKYPLVSFHTKREVIWKYKACHCKKDKYCKKTLESIAPNTSVRYSTWNQSKNG